MEQFQEFVGNHLGLWMALVAIIGALLWTSFGQGRGVQRIGPTDVTRLINSEEAVVVDVRSDAEFDSGHILNAIHIPATSLSQDLGKLKKYQSKPIITTCRSGQRSSTAGALLKKNGFEQVYTLSGGIAAWEGADLPLVKG